MVVGVVKPEMMGATLEAEGFFSARLGYLAVRYLSLFLLFVVNTAKDSHKITTGHTVQTRRTGVFLLYLLLTVTGSSIHTYKYISVCLCKCACVCMLDGTDALVLSGS